MLARIDLGEQDETEGEETGEDDPEDGVLLDPGVGTEVAGEDGAKEPAGEGADRERRANLDAQ